VRPFFVCGEETEAAGQVECSQPTPGLQPAPGSTPFADPVQEVLFLNEVKPRRKGQANANALGRVFEEAGVRVADQLADVVGLVRGALETDSR